jgi:hypothetical protein
MLPGQFGAVRMNHGTPDQLGAPGDKVKVFLCARADRRKSSTATLAIRESAKTTPWPPRPTFTSGPARQAAAANQSPHPP